MSASPPIMMANLGMADTLILMVMALVVFGPRRLPQIGRQIGKLMYEFRKASNDFKFQMEEELRASEEADRRKKEEEEERQRALAAAPPPQQIEQTISVAPETPTADPDSSALPPEQPAEIGAAEIRAAEIGADAPAATESAPTEPASGVTSENATETVAQQPPVEDANVVAEAATPRIAPPSVGEKVAAERPGKAAESVTPEAERSEPAAHHG
jgi:sec-independent protein translocase protein TatB